MAPPATVALARCPEYREPDLSRAIAHILERLEPLGLPGGGRILLKPNCLSSHEGPEMPVNTRAEVVRAVGRYLKENHGASLVIADSGGLGSYGRSEKVYGLMGLDKVARELGADLINLERRGLVGVKSPRGKVLKSFQATDLLEEVQAVVNLPKMKTHLLTGMTGAVKNCLGLLPGSLKRAVHVAAPSGSAMASALVDIYAGLLGGCNLSLHLMDGITAMEGFGPAQGKPRQAGILLASKDGVALDAVASAIMGFRPHKIETTRLAHQSGLGQGDPKHISLLGGDWADLTLKGFKHPFSLPQRLAARILPQALAGRVLERLKEGRPRPVPGNCERCGLCVSACPVEALTLDADGPVLDDARCIECYCCLEHCPSQGLRVPKNMRERLFGMSGTGQNR